MSMRPGPTVSPSGWHKRRDAAYHGVTCPLCLEHFLAADAPFRCAHPRCTKEPDTLLATMAGLRTPPLLGRVYKLPAKGLWARYSARRSPPIQAACPACAHLSDHRVCPGCHASLPPDFWQYPLWLIPIIQPPHGGRGLLLRAFEEKMTILGPDAFGVNFVPACEGRAYASPGLQIPPLWRFTAASRKQGGFTTQAFVHFCLIPPLNSGPDVLQIYAPYLERAAGLVIIVDPTTFPGLGGGVEDLSNNLVRQVAAMSLFNTTPPPPTAFVMTKSDRVEKFLPTGSLLTTETQPTTQPTGNYNPKPAELASDLTRGYLGTWGGLEMLQTISYKWATTPHSFFMTASQPQPRRVEEPFLWLFNSLRLRHSK